MPFEIKVIAEPGSATLCGKCKLRVGRVCAAFNKVFTAKLPKLRYGDDDQPLRLPECIAAEGAGRKGGDK